MRRNWIKLYVDQCLRGSMKEELDAKYERWIWFGLLLLAGDSAYEGQISYTDNTGYTDEQLADNLDVPVKVFIETKKRLASKNIEKIEILKNNIIRIVNWGKYQSEYQRQKPYRSEDGQKLLRKVTTKGDNEGLLIDREGERDRDIDRDLDKEDPCILNLLSKVKGYPFNEEKDLEFIEGLKADFPDLDALEEVKKKCAWWLGKPLLKKSNPHLQLRNWFIKAREFLKEGDKERKVGTSYIRDPQSFDLSDFLSMELISQIYQIVKSKGGDKGIFYDKARSAYPKIKPQWEQSDKTPETFIRLVEGV